jgi:hypothetical protein
MTKEIVEIERAREHGKATVWIARPIRRLPIPIKFHAVLVEIAQVQCLADAMVASGIETNARAAQPVQRIGKRCARGIEDCGVNSPVVPGAWG